MREYLLKRVLLMVPTLFLVTILVFLMMRLIPGDVVLQMLEGYAYADTVEALRRELGPRQADAHPVSGMDERPPAR